MIKAGSLSGRADFLSLFSHLCNKDEKRSLLFILVFLLVSICLLGILRCRRCSPQPMAPAAEGLLPWGTTCKAPGAMGQALSTPRATSAQSPSWPSSLCPEALLHGVRGTTQGFPEAGCLGERSRAEKMCF